MKKVLIVLMVFGLLVSCKSKGDSKETKTENKTKDDYQSGDDKMDKSDNTDNTDKTDVDYKEKNNANQDELDEDGNSKADVESITGQDDSEGWPQSERDGFMTNCVREAMKAGRTRSVSQNYCDCMLGKIEGMYPDINQAAKLNDADIKRITDKFAPGCLK
ncbi:MAG: hypothetical protein IPI78_02625 [Chitinophagaceae bacterium]|nr:hypothetical protein [Chitinophagaceae bacterium]